MSISDAFVRISCDSPGCGEEEELELPYVYGSMSPSSGHYDSSDRTLEKLAAKAGWKSHGNDHFCPACSEEAE